MKIECTYAECTYHKPIHERITEIIIIPFAIALLLGEKLNIIEYVNGKWQRKER